MSTDRNDTLYFCNVENQLAGNVYKLLQVSRIARANEKETVKSTENFHAHPFCELFFVLSGRGVFVVENERMEVGEGDLIIINANMRHTEFGVYNFYYCCLGIEGLHFRGFEKNCKIPLGKNWERVLFWLNDIYEACSKKQEYWKEITAANLQLIITFLRSFDFLKYSLTVEETKKERVELSQKSNSSIVEIVQLYLENNLREEVTLDELAKMVYVSKQYLMKLFKRETGYSPIHYHKRLKVARSQYNLLRRVDSVSAVASFIGFKSAYSYIKFFKSVTGYTPQEFRELYKNDLDTASQILEAVAEIRPPRGEC